ncbi:hypothetical protein [Actinomyces viscosus]|uniref:hypothetical protein n=3 Tax=Actinomyces viscosus TaxID=1656 RepID=UPI001E558FA7|nr:hypothetical protein [Actinomyces viscosus]
MKDWLNELTGDSDAVTAAASTWTNIGTELSLCADDLDRVCSSRLAGQESVAVAAFKSLQAGSAAHLRMTGQLAGAISGGLTVASVIVRMVHDLVRDAIADVVGKLASKVTIGVLTAGLAAPWAVSSAVTEVSSWATRLSKEVTDVVTSSKNLKLLLEKAKKLFSWVAEKFKSKAKDGKSADEATEATTPPNKSGGDGGTTPPHSKGGTPPDPDKVKKSQEAYERAQRAREEMPRGKKYKSRKTVSANGVKSLSGWSLDRPGGFQGPNVDEVLQVTDEMGFPRRQDFRDHGIDGQYDASHAERQEAVAADEPYIGVTRDVCENCEDWYRAFAKHRQQDWYVTDPTGTWFFRSDGTSLSPSGVEKRPTAQ